MVCSASPPREKPRALLNGSSTSNLCNDKGPIWTNNLNIEHTIKAATMSGDSAEQEHGERPSRESRNITPHLPRTTAATLSTLLLLRRRHIPSRKLEQHLCRRIFFCRRAPDLLYPPLR